MPYMENTCKLCSKCIKKDENLDECNNPECQNVIPVEILDGDDSRADEVDNNKPIEVDTPRLKQSIGDLPTLKKKLQTLPSSPCLT